MDLTQIKNSKPKKLKFGSDTIDLFIASYLIGEGLAPTREFMRAKTLTVNSEELSYRIINHWHNEGIVSDLRPSGKGWRKYSLIDRLWVEVIIELRKFGYPLERIRRAKEIFEYVDEDGSYSMPYLEAYFVIAFFFKEPCYILFYPDGKVALATFDEYNLSDGLSEVDSFISVNLNRLIQRIYPNKDLAAKFKHKLDLSPEEMQLLLFVRTGNFDTITVKRKDGKIDLIEATETLSADVRLTEIIKEQDYQNIEIKTSEGKTVCIKRTIKKKV